MTKEEFATLLNGRQYPFKLTKEENIIAEDNRFIVAYGESDDLLELEGFKNDEFDAYEGTTLLIGYDGTIPHNECVPDCPYFAKILKDTPMQIKAEWDKDGYSWVISSDLPYASFDIMEDGEKFCRAAVIQIT